MGILYERMIKIMSEKLYHVTLQDNLPLIYKTRYLIPQIGERSKILTETEEHIFLCNTYGIGYWRALLYGEKHTVVLEVDKADLDPQFLEKRGSEYLYNAKIPVYNLSISMDSINPAPYYYIKECAIATLCRCCHLCMYICDYHTQSLVKLEDYGVNLIERLSIIKFISNNIDLNKFCKDECNQKIKAGKGKREYEFLDTYAIKNDDIIKLCEEILEYHDDPYYDQIKWLNNFMKTTYADIFNYIDRWHKQRYGKSIYENISPETKM